MLTDKEICDALNVPDEDREELLNTLHAWSRQDPVGPNLYVVRATLIWAMMKSNGLRPALPDNPFDPADWEVPHEAMEEV